MIGRRKKQPPIQRSPHIVRQQQTTFHYSSNRSAAERTQRERPVADEDEPASRLTIPRVSFSLQFIVGLVIVIGLTAYLSLLSAKPHIAIKNGQAPLRSVSDYDTAANEIVGGSFLNHSKFAINRQKITQELEAKFPELSNVSVATPVFGRGVQISAESAQPAAILAANGGNYIVDTNGVALFDARAKHPAIKTEGLLLINDQSGVQIVIGKPALTPSQIAFATEVKRQSEAKQLTIDSIALVAGGGEMDVRYSGIGYFVKFNTYEDARKSFGTYYATKQFIESKKEVPAEYVDVRIPERAYSK